MSYSLLEFTGDGETVTFPIAFTLGYLSQDDVFCRVNNEVDVNGDPVYRSITWLPGNEGLVTIGGDVPEVGVPIVFSRVVDKDKLLYDFQKNDPIDERSLDESHLQLMMAMHEFLDGIGLTAVGVDIDMQGHKLINVYVDLDDPDSIATVGVLAEAVDAVELIESNVNATYTLTVAAKDAAELSATAAYNAQVAAEAAQGLAEDAQVAAEAAQAAAEAARDAVPAAETILVDEDVGVTVEARDPDILKADTPDMLQAVFGENPQVYTGSNIGSLVLTRHHLLWTPPVGPANIGRPVPPYDGTYIVHLYPVNATSYYIASQYRLPKYYDDPDITADEVRITIERFNGVLSIVDIRNMWGGV
jgi:hypothetical protein